MLSPITVGLVIVFVVLVTFMPIVILSTRYRRVAPSKALAVWAANGTGRPLAMVSGGGIFVPPLTRRTATLDLRLRFLDMVVPKVQMDKDGQGQLVRVRVGMLYRISSENSTLENAFAHLVGKSDKEIEEIVGGAVENAVREGLAKTSLDKVEGDRDALALKVFIPALEAMKAFGLEIRCAAIAEMELQGR